LLTSTFLPLSAEVLAKVESASRASCISSVVDQVSAAVHEPTEFYFSRIGIIKQNLIEPRTVLTIAFLKLCEHRLVILRSE